MPEPPPRHLDDNGYTLPEPEPPPPDPQTAKAAAKRGMNKIRTQMGWTQSTTPEPT